MKAFSVLSLFVTFAVSSALAATPKERALEMVAKMNLTEKYAMM